MDIKTELANTTFVETEESSLGKFTPKEEPKKEKPEKISNFEASQVFQDSIVKESPLYEPEKVSSIEKLVTKSKLDFSKKVTPNIDDSWTTIILPSNGTEGYKSEVKVRVLKVRQAAQISEAIESKNFSLFLDILDNNIELPIRRITQKDLRFFMFWLKENSYPNTPITLEWISKYDNKNITTIGKCASEYIKCTASQEAINKFKSLKMRSPLVADAEYRQASNFNRQDKWLWNYAKYFEGDTLDDKLNNLDNVPDYDSLITELDKEFDYGIEEYVTVVDSKFNAQEYIQNLEKKLEFCRQYNEDLQKRIATSASLGLQEELDESYSVIGVLTAELLELKSKPIEEVKPEAEKKLLPFRPINLLPNSQLVSYTE